MLGLPIKTPWSRRKMARSPEAGKRPHDPVIEIREIAEHEARAAIALLAAAMRENPLHVRAFGSDPGLREQRLGRFLAPLLAHVQQNGTVLGAFAGGRLAGILGLINPGRCRPGMVSMFRIGAGIAVRVDPLTLARIYRWLRIWERAEPRYPHYHIGPLAVAAPYRRRGIGSRLMVAGCEVMGRNPAPAWLETDLEINVAFYKRFGFTLSASLPVLGVPNWFMGRPAMADADRSLTPEILLKP